MYIGLYKTPNKALSCVVLYPWKLFCSAVIVVTVGQSELSQIIIH